MQRQPIGKQCHNAAPVFQAFVANFNRLIKKITQKKKEKEETFRKYIRRYFDTYEADTFHYADDFGSVGSSFPMSLGVKVAEPEREVVCLTGDGGFLLNCQELETAIREKIPVRVVIFNDFGYGNVRAYQRHKYGGRYLCDYGNPDFGKLAELFGAHGEQVDDPRLLQEAFLRVMKTDKPGVLDVLVDPNELGTPGFL